MSVHTEIRELDARPESRDVDAEPAPAEHQQAGSIPAQGPTNTRGSRAPDARAMGLMTHGEPDDAAASSSGRSTRPRLPTPPRTVAAVTLEAVELSAPTAIGDSLMREYVYGPYEVLIEIRAGAIVHIQARQASALTWHLPEELGWSDLYLAEVETALPHLQHTEIVRQA